MATRGEALRYGKLAAPKVELGDDKWKNAAKLIGDAIQFIHSKKVIDNDLQRHNIVLEKSLPSNHH